MADAVLAALRAVADAVPADPGVIPAGAGYVATPASVESAAAVLRVAAEQGLAVTVRGAGTKQDWGYPPRRLDLIVDTGRLTGVVEHAAGDLIVVVRAGTPLGELNEELAPAQQQFALDAPLAGATVGGTVAVNASGPRRLRYGTVRDLLIGVTVIRPDGVVARAGGKVVKNVAGYDLGKLMTGSYGTLGMVAECVFRLHPLPEKASVVSSYVDSPAEAGRLVAAVLDSQAVPSAVELDAPAGGGIEVAVLVEGVPAGVEQRVATVRRMVGGSVSETLPGWWSAYPWSAGDTGLKLTAALSRVPAVLSVLSALSASAGLAVRGSAGTGVLYAGLPASVGPETVAQSIDELRAATREAGGHTVVLTAPAAVRERVDLWGPVDGLDLMRRIKQQFDPDSRFAPGRFVGGIC